MKRDRMRTGWLHRRRSGVTWCVCNPKKSLIWGARRHHRLSQPEAQVLWQARRGESCSPGTPFGHPLLPYVREGMELVYQRCCGIDIHKKVIVACVIMVMANGQRHKELRIFRTVTGELLQLLDWLKAAGCTHVAMESTGVYWKPIYNLLEGHFE